MASVRFDGSGVALVTPFRDGSVDERAVAQLVRFHHENGTDALVVCGSTGEAAAMTAEEQYRVIVAAVEANAGRLPVIAGCGGTDTRHVMELARGAERAGADGVLLSAPPYSRPPQRGLIAHFQAVMDATDLAAILYNVPSRAAVNLLPDSVAELAADGRVAGVKEASGDIGQVAELARLVGDRLHIWSGNDDQIVPILSLGGRGVITVLGNIAPRETSRMVHAYLTGDPEAARRLQLRLLPLVQALFAESNPILVKTALGWMGFDVGPLRAPLPAADPALAARLRAAMDDAGIVSARVASA